MGKIRIAANALVALSIGTSFLVGCGREENGVDYINLNQTDIDFVRAAAMSNFAEISLAKIDTAKGQKDSSVVAFAKMMIDEHTSSDSALKVLATAMGMTAPDSLDPDQQALKAQLTGLTGRELDSVYIHSQVASHQAAITLYTKEASSGQQYQLKLHANSTLPNLQEHLDSATAISARY